MGPLAGTRVLDLSRILAGPTATQTLADLGADVIKVERPRSGDDTRRWAPPFVRASDGRDSTETTYFACANRGKRSIAIDLARPEGAELIRRLARTSDVLVENYKVGDLARHGLDHATLSVAAPRLVYCSITGFGQTGPYAARPGYDPVAQAMGGLMSVTGPAEGDPGAGPQRVGVAVTDLTTGIYAVVAILAALLHRVQSGRGQYIDLALFDVQVASLANVAQAYLSAGESGRRHGTAHPSVVPSQVFRCSEGSVMLVAGNDAQFRALCGVLGRPDLAQDPRFADNAGRRRHSHILLPAIAGIVATRSAAAWTEQLCAAGVPCGPVNDMAAVFADPQVQARDMRISLRHPTVGTLEMAGSPLRFSATPVEYRRPPPVLGEHTDAVLRDELGLDAVDIARLRTEGVVG